MEGGDKNSPIKLKQEAENSRLNRRKETIKKVLFDKRFFSAKQNEQSFPATMNAQEGNAQITDTSTVTCSDM